MSYHEMKYVTKLSRCTLKLGTFHYYVLSYLEVQLRGIGSGNSGSNVKRKTPSYLRIFVNHPFQKNLKYDPKQRRSQ
jgi:hypothetical protein